MPTIGFFELLLISVVALLVLGPERLPGAIRTTSLWVGRARRSFNKVRSEIERELNADEIRRQLHNESILADLDKAKKQARDLTTNANLELQKLSSEIKTGTASATGEAPATAADVKADMKADASAEIPATAPGPEEDERVTPSEAPTATPAAKAPVEDFYNNPGIGTVELRNGIVQPVAPPAEASPSEKSVNK